VNPGPYHDARTIGFVAGVGTILGTLTIGGGGGNGVEGTLAHALKIEPIAIVAMIVKGAWPILGRASKCTRPMIQVRLNARSPAGVVRGGAT
jgi:hypothetical protein